MIQQAFLADGIRTPIGSFGGALSAIRADDLAAHVIQKLLERHPQLDPSAIADVYFGCANQAGEDNRNVARMALLLAGLPHTVPGETVNRLCASGMAAVIHAKRAINTGDGDLLLAGGVEHMTRAPYVMSKSAKPFGTDAQLYDSSFGWRFVNPKMQDLYGTDAMGVTAENLAEIAGACQTLRPKRRVRAAPTARCLSPGPAPPSEPRRAAPERRQGRSRPPLRR